MLLSITLVFISISGPYAITRSHRLANDSYPLTPITISLQYARLIRVLEPEHQHRNLLAVFTEWQDPRLQWNSSEYGGIDHIYITRYTVWLPEFYPCERFLGSLMQKFKILLIIHAMVVYPDQIVSIRLNASGNLNTLLTFSAFFSCEFDVYRFPFDKQNCFYCFILYNYDHKDELRFNARYANHPFIYDTSEWSLKLHGIWNRETVASDFNIGLVYYNISLTRKPQFWVGLVITPTFVIGSLIIIGLFFGFGADIINNAVGLGLTTMMSMMVIVGILANALAKSSYIPLLGWYVLVEIVIITFAVLAFLYSEILCNATSFLVIAACAE
ncbi:hypothetical protein PMAYCL1PPCAC_14973, partial [Pristionchus mayeri]